MLTKAEEKHSYELKKLLFSFILMHSAKGTNLIYHCDSKVIMMAAEASSEKSNQMNLAVLSFVNL
jgi:hypothetical protein